MTTVKEIEKAVLKLPENEFLEFAEWFRLKEKEIHNQSEELPDDLEAEFAMWDAASNEDFLRFESEHLKNN